RHALLPYHRIQKWTGRRFVKTDLCSLGLVVQLHHLSLTCMNTVKCHVKLRILHTNGIHHVELRFCSCEKRIPQYIQLLHRGIYPASSKDGRIMTCTTFDFLNSLQMHSFTGKISTYNFYRATELQMDSTGLRVPSSQYKPLLQMIRQWRYLHMIIRSGSGHDLQSITGDLVVEGHPQLQCPSCAFFACLVIFDGKLITAFRFLYSLRVCVDANFHLKEQLVSSHSRDPALADGLGYFVKRKPYDAWVDAKGDSNKINNCVPLAALTKQNTKFSKGLQYMGVGGICCGQSEMILKVANLKKGERCVGI
ncbi:hypothetical protein V5O48_017723, partial [Marasmius crinis-equi]